MAAGSSSSSSDRSILGYVEPRIAAVHLRRGGFKVNEIVVLAATTIIGHTTDFNPRVPSLLFLPFFPFLEQPRSSVRSLATRRDSDTLCFPLESQKPVEIVIYLCATNADEMKDIR